MRSCAVCLSVVGFLLSANHAWAAPKKGKKAAANSAEVAPEPIKEPKSTDVDSLMEDSTKKKTAPKPSADSTSDGDGPKADAPVGEPDAWERPPMEEEKPKKTRGVAVEAPTPTDGRNMEARLMVGYGFSTTNVVWGDADPYGLGFGLRGSYELDWHLVIGVGFEYFIGQNTPSAVDPVTGVLHASSRCNYMIGHAELGYNVWMSEELILRPSLWAGASIGTSSPPLNSGTTGVELAMSLSPGLMVDYIMGSTGWFVGFEGRINLILGQGQSGLNLWGALGKRF